MKPFAHPAALFAAAAALMTSAPAAADLAPNSGTFSVSVFEHTWGRGAPLSCDDLDEDAACSTARMSDHHLDLVDDFNDEASSYQICNNLGASTTFRVQMYRDANYVGRFEYRLITLDDGACITRNLTINDALSSFHVAPL